MVVTSHDQGAFVEEAVASAVAQTLPPAELVVVDDASIDAASLAALERFEDRTRSEGVRVLRLPEKVGVSAARNAGITATRAPLLAVLDGDDAWEPEFLAETTALLEADTDVRIASTWMRLHGAVDAVVRPPGGDVTAFLAANACPASIVASRADVEASGGYDETMRRGFEDWDLALRILSMRGRAGIVPAPRIRYRTAPASANIRSMEHRIDLVTELVRKHRAVYAANVEAAAAAWERLSTSRLAAWEALVVHDPSIALPEPTYGDGGMAAAVRIATARAAAL